MRSKPPGRKDWMKRLSQRYVGIEEEVVVEEDCVSTEDGNIYPVDYLIPLNSIVRLQLANREHIFSRLNYFMKPP